MITNGETLELRRRIATLENALFTDGNHVGNAGVWKIFFNRQQGVWAEGYPDGQFAQIKLTGPNAAHHVMVVSKTVSYQEWLNALAEIAEKMQASTVAIQKKMEKLNTFYATLATDLKNPSRKLHFRPTTKKYHLPE